MPETRRSNPTHWIWSVDCPSRFTPDEQAYLAVRGAMGAMQVYEIEALIDEGMSAERMIRLFRFADHGAIPPAIEAIIGNALAYWVARAQEETDA